MSKIVNPARRQEWLPCTYLVLRKTLPRNRPWYTISRWPQRVFLHWSLFIFALGSYPFSFSFPSVRSLLFQGMIWYSTVGRLLLDMSTYLASTARNVYKQSLKQQLSHSVGRKASYIRFYRRDKSAIINWASFPGEKRRQSRIWRHNLSLFVDVVHCRYLPSRRVKRTSLADWKRNGWL